VLVYTHEDCVLHVTPPGHPERVERLAAVERGLAGLVVERRDAPLADEAEVLRCHPEAYLEKVRRAVPETGWVALDGDTILSPGSLDAALRAVGGICAAVDAVMAGEAARPSWQGDHQGIMRKPRRRWGFACSERWR
jgi:acetoin utilization deacetylase AcuC-like enzyme